MVHKFSSGMQFRAYVSLQCWTTRLAELTFFWYNYSAGDSVYFYSRHCLDFQTLCKKEGQKQCSCHADRKVIHLWFDFLFLNLSHPILAAVFSKHLRMCRSLWLVGLVGTSVATVKQVQNWNWGVGHLRRRNLLAYVSSFWYSLYIQFWNSSGDSTISNTEKG